MKVIEKEEVQTTTTKVKVLLKMEKSSKTKNNAGSTKNLRCLQLRALSKGLTKSL